MESLALTGLFPPIAYSFDGKAGSSPPKLAAHRSRGRLQPDNSSTLGVVSFPRDSWLAGLGSPGWLQAGCLRCHLEAAALVAPHLPLRGKPRGVADDIVSACP